MARPLKQEFMNELFAYLKTEWYKNGQRPFNKTLKEIARDIYQVDKTSSAQDNMVLRYTDDLENAGYIKKNKQGGGTKPTEFVILNEQNIETLFNVRKEAEYIQNEFTTQMSNIIQKVTDDYNNIFKEKESILGELLNIKEAIKDLSLWGVSGPENQEIFIAKKDSQISTIIKQLQSSDK